MIHLRNEVTVAKLTVRGFNPRHSPSVKHILTCSYLISANRLESKQFQVLQLSTKFLNYYKCAK